MIHAVQNDLVYNLDFKYDPKLINIVKQVPGRRYIVTSKQWEIPADKLGWFLNLIKGTPYESQLQIHSTENIDVNESLDQTNQIPDVDISDITQYVRAGFHLYPHQVDFLKYMKSKNRNGFILADSPGLGKTLEVTNMALYHKQVYQYQHCLIICCVNTSKFSWKEDIETHTNNMEQAYILGTRKKRGGGFSYGGGDAKLEDLVSGHMYGDTSCSKLPYFLILNIEALRTKSGKKFVITNQIIQMIQSGQIGMIAIDEIHKNASPKSLQGKCLLEIKKKTGVGAEWIPMTGTPIVNKPTDVYLPLKLIDGHRFKDYYSWCRYFCLFGGYGDHEILGYRNIPQLKTLLQSNMLRRLKEDVLDLPEKIRFTEYVENTSIQSKLYAKVTNDILSERDEIVHSANPLVKMIRLRQVNGSPELIDDQISVTDNSYVSKNAKLARTLELIDDIVERGEKVVIFSNWVAPLKTLYRFIAAKYKVCCFTGTMDEVVRQKHKRVFLNNPNYKVMLGTIGALGVNHTLTSANNVIFYDDPWNPATKQQAEDRVYRIGTTRSVNIYTLITKDTIDEVVNNILKSKQDISNYIVDDDLNIRNNPELFDKLLGK